MYIAIFNPTHKESLILHQTADRIYHNNLNGYGVKVTTWDRDKIEIFYTVKGGYNPQTVEREMAHAIAREFHHRMPTSDAALCWGPVPQEPEEDTLAEDLQEWIAASCGEC